MRAVKKLIREFVIAIIRISMAPYFFRLMDGINAPIILNYHNPDPQVFRSHLQWYKDRFNFVTLDSVLLALNSGNFDKLPSKPLVITFDDGHKGNYNLISLFHEFQVHPTIYVCSGIVGTSRKFWFKAITNPQIYKNLPHDTRIQKLKEEIGFELTKEYGDIARQALTREELRELAEVADIGCHTQFHPILTTLSDKQVENEIIGSKIELEQILGRQVNHFAYPNGDYSLREIKVVVKAGYLSARTINSSVLKTYHRPFELPVIGITDDASINMVAVQLSRIPTRMRNLIRNGRFTGNYNSIKI